MRLRIGVNSDVWASRAFFCLLAAVALHAEQPPRPEFTAYQIGPTGGRLWPGRMFSIYGKHLGPAEPCARDAGAFRPDGPNPPEVLDQVERVLPVELCGVQILIDEQPVPLIYVQEKQINFVVPNALSASDKVALRLVYSGVSSIPITLRFGPDRMMLYQEQPTYTGMPVWVRLYNVANGKIPVELPFGFSPLWPPLQCAHIELKYGGVPIAEERSVKNPPQRVRYSGPPCPAPQVPDRQSLAGRIPLHLLYPMDRAGTYLARYVPGVGTFASLRNTAETEWVPVELKPGTAERRRAWLQAQVRAAPTDRETLLYDFLPSIFGYGDPETLAIGVKYLYSPESAVASAAEGYLRTYYTPAQLIPAIVRAQQARGRNVQADRLLRNLRGNSSAR